MTLSPVLRNAATGIVTAFILVLFLSSCEKNQVLDQADPATPAFTKFIIRAGQQYSDPSPFKETDYSELKFIVKFDSSAIYQVLDPENQLDVNKLLGFSDNSAEHQHFSARIGWRWSDGALRLFAYVYNNSVRSFEELSAISIGEEHACSIKVSSGSYIFSVDNITRTMPRSSTTATAKGYKLYPYFGGDETAPHDIYIWIREL